ncbi:hatching enzyme 1.2-like [Chironomus tepperi]|uniref:hatching enzyme 1.2-like n=1 Tax=Chironomus tepperi TaxID=113505 RepID=UPI00391F5555
MKFLLLQISLLCLLVALNANPIELEQEYGDKFQGDIVLTPEQQTETEHTGRAGRTGTVNTKVRWPKINGRVTVPYVIDADYSSSERNLILTAMNEISTKTCVSFIPRSTQTDYIRIFSGDGCWSYVGRIGGKQDLSLKRSGCMVHGIAMHEMIHALGYGHMHQHYQRDSRVRINYGNIQSGMDVWFKTLDPASWNNYGTSYDISSVMHYGPYSFSRNGQMTIQAYSSTDQKVMGQRSYLSSGDVARIKNMYAC